MLPGESGAGPKSQTGGLVTAWPCGSVVALILWPPQECKCRPTARPRGALFPPAAKCNFMQRAGKRLRPRTDLFPACHAVINARAHMPCAARPCFRLLPVIAAISCASISACIHPSRVQPLTAPSGSSALVSSSPSPRRLFVLPLLLPQAGGLTLQLLAERRRRQPWRNGVVLNCAAKSRT